MFERYTETARRTIFFARYEASQFGSTSIETEHLLLGLFREERGLISRILGESAGEAPEMNEPQEIVEARERIQSLVKRMENAIANHDFKEARVCSDEERKERENLRVLCEKYHLTDSSGGLIPEGGLMGEIRRRIESLTPRNPKISTSADLPLSHESKRVLAYGAEESERMSHGRIGPEHLFLGLLREEKSLAAMVLQEHGVRLSLAREEIAKGRPEGPTPKTPGRAGALGRGGGMILMHALQDAGRAAMLAREEAAKRQGQCIETIDLLTALLLEKGVVERFLIPVEALHAHKKFKLGPRGEQVSLAELAYSEECKQAFAFASEEAAQLGQRTGPGHLLLGILRVENCAAAEILRDCGFTAAGVRAQLMNPPPSSDPEQGRKYV
jgi:ATP-dependent Clp protease ATP-binding subunit ClpA